MGLPKRLRKSMTAKAINGAELARRIGVKRQAISNWLAGRAEPTQHNLRSLAVILDIEQEWLSSGRKSKPDLLLTEQQCTEAIRACEGLEAANAKLQQACKNIIEILNREAVL
jgi:transcriptional regulator with XRE-family HTH domain